MKLLLVFLLLLRFETTIGVSQEELITHENFEWNNACSNHPFAKNGTANKAKDSAGFPDYTCNLKFDYDRELVKNNDQDELEATAFCELQYPHRLVNWVPNGKTLLCQYKVFRVCLTKANIQKPSAWIGDYCVYLLKKPYKQEEAQKKCEEVTGVKDSLLKDETVAGHIMRWYKSDQVDSKRIWINKKSDDFASKNEMHLMNLDYEAVGNRRPGHMFKLKGKGGDKEAMVACVTDSVHLGGEKQKVSHCGMLKEFFKMKTFENPDEKFKNLELTCYTLSQSIMVAMQHTNKSSQLSTVEHFHNYCPLRQNNQQKEKKYAVFPSSKYQIVALNALRNSYGKDVLLTGNQEEVWGRQAEKKYDETKESVERSFFAYRRIKSKLSQKDIANKTITESAGFSAYLWKTGYPKQPEGSEAEATFPNQGALVWTKDGSIENGYNYRRAPIVCAAGVQTAEFYECADGWEMVERAEEKKAFCYKAFSGDCLKEEGSWYTALDKCKANGNGSLAPGSTDEELAAITAAVRTWNGGKLKYKSMLVGGAYSPVSEMYEWTIDLKPMDPKFGFVSNQPDRQYRYDCRSWWPLFGRQIKAGLNKLVNWGRWGIGWKETGFVCPQYVESVAALRFSWYGNPEGLIDVVPENPCFSIGEMEEIGRKFWFNEQSPTTVVGYVCAVEAKNRLVDV